MVFTKTERRTRIKKIITRITRMNLISAIRVIRKIRDMQTAKRLDGIGEYYFSQKLREIDELNKQGKQIINLGIGSPDLPPHPDVIKTLQEESAKPNVHAYQSYKGSIVLRKAMSDWYKKWYNVELNPDTEIKGDLWLNLQLWLGSIPTSR